MLPRVRARISAAVMPLRLASKMKGEDTRYTGTTSTGGSATPKLTSTFIASPDWCARWAGRRGGGGGGGGWRRLVWGAGDGALGRLGASGRGGRRWKLRPPANAPRFHCRGRRSRASTRD